MPGKSGRHTREARQPDRLKALVDRPPSTGLAAHVELTSNSKRHILVTSRWNRSFEYDSWASCATSSGCGAVSAHVQRQRRQEEDEAREFGLRWPMVPSDTVSGQAVAVCQPPQRTSFAVQDCLDLGQRLGDVLCGLIQRGTSGRPDRRRERRAADDQSAVHLTQAPGPASTQHRLQHCVNRAVTHLPPCLAAWIARIELAYRFPERPYELRGRPRLASPESHRSV